MNLEWSLDELYTSFESQEFKNDMETCLKKIGEITEWARINLEDKANAKDKLEAYITNLNEFYDLFTRLLSYSELVLSVNARSEKALQFVEKLEHSIIELTGPQVVFQKWVSSLENLDEVIGESELLEEHRFFIEEVYANSRYMLSEKEEILAAKMKNTGSGAWSKLQELLTSTLLVDIKVNGEEKRLPLSTIRNMAHEKEAETRKTAYHAELESYKKIEDSSAACLNGIKGEVITMSQMRGYSSPLEKSLIDSRIDEKALQAMLAAIREFLPVFHKYYRKKAELLGHSNGLPFYDLFAPMGSVDMRFTYDEAREFIVKNFRSFSDKLADYADNAFKKRWIDVEPREGKRGGAFCSNLHSIKESRILTNFTGSFNDVTTLAHELGHGYHGECLVKETYLNNNYTMPIAETASIFCETIIKNAALKTASEEETFAILENDLADSGQVIVDIYSRFLFESRVFERRVESSLSVNELKEIMISAQKEAYGDGLDQNCLHPYMWACKPHYYYAEANFYNFPYAFGLLFAKGLYAEYLKRGQAFVEEYDKLLATTGKKNIADVAAMAGIDVHSVDYWRSALKLIEDDIEKFIALK
ncbi:MAG: M3 family oligoendopeptidase [Clostridia bacterium]|nr:M3 family oligoendopeptidase [Clostridia bacterium]